jgi:hypothetical protein
MIPEFASHRNRTTAESKQSYTGPTGACVVLGAQSLLCAYEKRTYLYREPFRRHNWSQAPLSTRRDDDVSAWNDSNSRPPS